MSNERFLDGMQTFALTNPFDGYNLTAVGLNRQNKAGIYQFAVHKYIACAAISPFAAVLYLKGVQLVAEDMQKGVLRQDLKFEFLSVEQDMDS